ncbi:chloride channel protein [Candidatus Saccharibacteria bacterium]|nr:MAG: chloride channel protein [Candidatus Saccharibacteria bacterium]
MTTKGALKAYALSAIFGALGGLVTIGVVVALDHLMSFVWKTGFGVNPDAPTRSLMVFPVLFLVGAIIGVLVRRSGKVDGLDAVMTQVLTTGSINWRHLPRALVMAVLSLGSGASLGPEAPASVASVSLASFAAEKTKANATDTQTMNVSAMSGMLGGMMNSPFMVPAMIAESVQKKLAEINPLLVCSMISSAFGVGAMVVVLGKVFSIDLGVPPSDGANLTSLLWAFLFGIAGAVGGVLVFLMGKRVTNPLMAKLHSPVTKALVAALFMALVAYAFPLTMFSGQHTVPQLIGETAQLTALYLIVIALAKMLATTVLIEGGFFGGPIFPAIFAGVAFGLAFDHLFGVSLTIAVPAAVGGLLTLVQQKPFTAALLTVGIVGTTTAPITALGVAGGLIVLLALKNLQQKQTAKA